MKKSKHEKSFFIRCCGILIFGFFSNKSQAQLVLPTMEQVKWSEAEIGVIMHYDINIFAPETFRYNDKYLPKGGFLLDGSKTKIVQEREEFFFVDQFVQSKTSDKFLRSFASFDNFP